eukprot:6473381-Amphidinium_carterae.1
MVSSALLSCLQHLLTDTLSYFGRLFRLWSSWERGRWVFEDRSQTLNQQHLMGLPTPNGLQLCHVSHRSCDEALCSPLFLDVDNLFQVVLQQDCKVKAKAKSECHGEGAVEECFAGELPQSPWQLFLMMKI